MSAARKAYTATLKVLSPPNAAPRQFEICNDTKTFDDFDRQYVNISGFFGEHVPHTFAVAPEMLGIMKRWAALDGAAWHVERFERERQQLLADTRALILRAEGLA